MPTYEYECRACGHRFERFQAMSAEPLKRCPQCSGPVNRLIGAGAAVIVKGGTSRPAPECGRDVLCERCPYEQ